VVVGVGHEHQLLQCSLLEAERPGANRLGVEFVVRKFPRGHVPEDMSGQEADGCVGEEGGAGLGQLKAYGALVHLRDGNTLPSGGEIGVTLKVEVLDRLHREDHIIGGHGLAVVPHGVLAKLEGVR
jgi:hypothetical protein